MINIIIMPKGNLMASIVDSIRSVYQDNYSLLKLGGMSYIMYILYSMMSFTSDSFNIINFIVFLIIFYLYGGFCCIIIGNRINQNIQTLPTMNLALYVNVCTKSFFIAIPSLLIGYVLGNFVVGLFNFESIPQLIAIWIIRFFVFVFLVTAYINFAEKYELKEGFNITKLLNGVADVLVYTVVSLIVLVILSIFLVAPTLFLVYNFFEFGPLFNYVAIFFITMNLAFLSDYWGQLYFDIESKNNYY